MTTRPTILRASESSGSWASSAGVRRSMRSNKRTDTLPERRVRSLLHAYGLRFRKDFRIQTASLRVNADIAFPRARVAVFIDGCFWHCCTEHRSIPKTNRAFWASKLARNIERDHRVVEALDAGGWTVLRFWEHEDPELVAAAIGTAIDAARVEAAT